MALTDNLYGWWKLNDTGTTCDDSHSTLDGTNSAGVEKVASGGVNNGAYYDYDGSTDTTYFGDVAKPNSAISIAFWIKCSAQASERFIVCHAHYDGAWYGYRVSIGDDGYIYFFCSDGAGHYLDFGKATNLADGSWHHVVCTFNGTTGYIYTDNGTPNSNTDFSGYSITYTTSHNLRFGSNETGDGNFYDGSLDLVGIWSRAISASEVDDLYKNGPTDALDYPFTSGGPISGNTHGTSSVSATTGSSSTLENGLYGHWGLDETAGSTCYDDTANNLDGTGYNITYNNAGRRDLCYTFNGSSSYVDMGAVAHPTAAISISCWVRIASHPSETKWIVDNESYSTNYYGYRLQVYTSGYFTFYLFTGTSNYLEIYTETDIADNTWHHLVFTWNGTTAYVYLDNDKDAGTSWSISIGYQGSAEHLVFGRSIWSDRYYSGNLDLVAIWNRALTDAEVSNLYSSGLGLDYPYDEGELGESLIGNSHGIASLSARFVSVNTRYCDPDGVDTSGRDGTIGQEWHLPSYAATRVTTAGWTIHVNAGTYADSSRIVLAAGVNLEGDDEATTTINCSYNASSFSDAAIYAVSSSVTSGGQTISNLTITGSSYAASRGIYTRYRDDFVIHDCTIQNFDKSGINAYSEIDWVTPPSTYTTGLRIYNCTINNNTESPDNGGECNLRWSGHEDYAIYNNTISSTTRVTPRSIYSSQVKNGKIYGNTFNTRESISSEWLFTMELWNNRGGIEIYDNTINGGGTIDIGGHTTQKGSYDYGVSIHDNEFLLSALVPYDSTPTCAITVECWDSIESVYVYSNYMINFPWGINITAGQADAVIEDVYVYSNLIVNSASSNTSWASFGIGIVYQTPGITRDNINVWNNTIIGGQTYSFRGIYLSIDGTNTNIEFKNNIIQGFDYPIRVEDESSGNTGTLNYFNVDYNLLYSNDTSSVSFEADLEITNYTNTGQIVDDPEFVSSSDFHLSSTSSPAYRAGVDVDLLADFDGNAWGVPPSIGAYEYGTGSASVPDTFTFCLSVVVEVVNPTTDDLEDCFNDAIADWFDPVYEGAHDRLSNFRNYGAMNAPSAALQGQTHGISSGNKATPAGGSGLHASTNGNAIVIGELSSTGGTYCDWWLPSQSELNSMYSNLRLYGVGNFNTTSGYYYWTSTEVSATNAYAVTFYNGGFLSTAKGTTTNMLIRPCRSFTTAASYSLRSTGQAGGLIFYIYDNGDGTYTYYEAALTDINNSHAWSNVTSSYIGTTSSSIGEGLNNSNEIVAQIGETDSAAAHCLDYCAGTGSYKGPLVTSAYGASAGNKSTPHGHGRLYGNTHGVAVVAGGIGTATSEYSATIWSSFAAGCVDHSGSVWSTVRSATSGTNSHDYNYSPQKCGVQYNGSTYYIRRVFAGFDLSAYAGRSLLSIKLVLPYSYTGTMRTVAVLYGTQNNTISTVDFDAFTFSNYALSGSQAEYSNGSCSLPYYREVVASAGEISALSAYMGSTLKLAILHTYDNANYSGFGSAEHNLDIGYWGGEQASCSGIGIIPYLRITYS